MNPNGKPWLAFAALSLIWGSSFLWIKIAVQELGPMTLVAFRLFFGLAALLAAALITRQRIAVQRRDIRSYAVVAVLNTALPFTLISWGETRVDSAMAAVLNGAMPLFVLVIAHFWLQDERINWLRLSGLLVGFIGVGLVVGLGLDGLTSENLLGQLAVLGGALSYALANTYSRRFLRNRQPLAQATMVVLISELILWVGVSLFERPLQLPQLAGSWTAVLWLGLLGTGLAYLLYFYLLNAWGSTRSSLITYVMPVIGVALGVGLLGEQVDARMLLGTLLVIAGVALVNRKSAAKPAQIGQRPLIGAGQAPSHAAPGALHSSRQR